MTRPADPYARAKIVWERMALVRPGMTKREVEALLGPPDEDIDPGEARFGGGRTYFFAWKPGTLAPSKWVANYDTSGPMPVLIFMGGPVRNLGDISYEQIHQHMMEIERQRIEAGLPSLAKLGYNLTPPTPPDR